MNDKIINCGLLPTFAIILSLWGLYDNQLSMDTLWICISIYFSAIAIIFALAKKGKNQDEYPKE